MQNKLQELCQAAALIIKRKKPVIAFTGAGISAESGIPPFRGENGIWNKYDPKVLEINYFHQYPLESWKAVREIFYQFFENIAPNPAHYQLAEWEKQGIVSSIITQNIDNLHQKSGSNKVIEFHGTSARLICTGCSLLFDTQKISLLELPPSCPSCKALLKPDFIFFGEGIPTKAYDKSLSLSQQCAVMLIIGTSGEVAPANQLPWIAKNKHATIIEINAEPSLYTPEITDLFIQGKAGEILPLIHQYLQAEL